MVSLLWFLSGIGQVELGIVPILYQNGPWIGWGGGEDGRRQVGQSHTRRIHEGGYREEHAAQDGAERGHRRPTQRTRMDGPRRRDQMVRVRQRLRDRLFG